MNRSTPGELARAAAEKALSHANDPKRIIAFESRGLGDQDQLARAVMAAWSDRTTEWHQQSRGGIQWVNRDQGLAGAINFKEPSLSTVWPYTDRKKLDRDVANWLARDFDDQGAPLHKMRPGPVPVARAIREREFRDNLATIAPRKFSDLMRDDREPARDEPQRDERSR